MGDMQLFTQDIGGQNVAIKALMVDGDPWFRGTDVASSLGYTSPQQSIRDHVHEHERRKLGDVWLNAAFTP